MFSSLFSYSLERRYPFKWFTPAVFIGGIIAITLASFLSVATQGYETVSIYTPDPDDANANDGSSSNNLFAEWPSFLTANTKSLCSPTPIPVGTQLLTNNTALRYTLRSITHSSDGIRPPTLVGSFPYLNNPFRNCSITAVDIEFDILGQDAVQMARELWGVVIKAYVDCAVDTPTGPASLGLFTRYERNTADRLQQFASQPNTTTQASLAAGKELLHWYATNASDAMQEQNDLLPPEKQVFKGLVSFVRTQGPTGAVNVTSRDYFFASNCFFQSFNSSTGGQDGTYLCDRTKNVTELIAEPVEKGTMPGIWGFTDSAAKMFYWTVLTDLGQTERARMNPLVVPELMAYFSSNLSAGARAGKAWEESSLLGVSPSVIATSYLCQVPRLKSTGTLVVAVLVNDIVLLSVLWRLFVFLVGYFLLRPDMMVCEGCCSSDASSASSGRAPLLSPEEKRVLRMSTV